MQRAKKLKEIILNYETFYSSIKREGKSLVRDTEKGIWGVSKIENVFQLFNKLRLQNCKRFIDLGSGDGCVVLVASLFTESEGIEYDKELVDTSNKMKKELNLNADFIKGDFMKLDLSRYDFIFINPDHDFKSLENKLIKEMSPKARLFIYNNIFLPEKLKKGKTYWFNQVPIISYRKN
jgi:precorrin-6B methylase 2